MMRLTAIALALSLAACASSEAPRPSTPAAAPADAAPALPVLAGDWWGTLEAGGQQLRLVTTFAQDGEGYTGKLISLDQGNAEIDISDIALTATSLTFDVPQVGGSYRGIWQDGEWVGSWMQGSPMPLTLVRGRPDTASVSATEGWPTPEQAAIAAKLAALTQKEGVIGAAAMIDGGNVITAMSDGLDPKARFEIGSITKVFTSMLLADLVLEGKISLDDTLADHIDGIADERVRAITLRDLSNHRSGLPRLPENLMPFAMLPDPYAGYDEAMLLQWIRSVEPVRDRDTEHEYSNGAVGLLGWLLGKAAGSDYKTAIVERLAKPMGMMSTDFSTDGAITGTVAGTPASLWQFDALAGAGALRSTIGDMARFAAILVDPPERWTRHVALMTQDQKDGGNGMTIGLGLYTIPVTEGGVLFHNGATGSFKSTMWVDRQSGRAAVAMVNDAAAELDPLGAWMIAGIAR